MEYPSKAWRRANPEKNRAHQKRYAERHKVEIAERKRLYQLSLSPEQKEQRREYLRAWRKANLGPEYIPVKDRISKTTERYNEKGRLGILTKKEARAAVRREVRAGRLIKESCAKCGKNSVHAHHHRGYGIGYLDVIWLCQTHHKQEHRDSTSKLLLVA